MILAYVRVIAVLSRALALLATVLLIAAMGVVCQMILMRYVFRLATVWQTDFVVFAATAAMFLGAPYVLLKGGHVGVDVLDMLVGKRTRARLRLVANVLGLAFCLIMLAATWIQFYEAWEGDWRHASVWAPRLWIPLAVLPVSFALLSLQYLAKILAVATQIPEDNAEAAEPAEATETGQDAYLKELPQ